MKCTVFRKTSLVAICRVDWSGRSLEDELYVIAIAYARDYESQN